MRKRGEKSAKSPSFSCSSIWLLLLFEQQQQTARQHTHSNKEQRYYYPVSCTSTHSSRSPKVNWRKVSSCCNPNNNKIATVIENLETVLVLLNSENKIMFKECIQYLILLLFFFFIRPKRNAMQRGRF